MLEDFHAARVLPGYEPDNKIKLLQELRDQVEIVIAINANNIEHSKARGDLGISYSSLILLSGSYPGRTRAAWKSSNILPPNSR